MLATLAIAVICGIFAPPAQAGYIVTLQQLGPDVVATGTGTIDYTDLTPLGAATQNGPFIRPAAAVIVTGTTGTASVDVYTGFSGPMDFGGGFSTQANSGSGDRVGIGGFTNLIVVPTGYLSGTLLTSSSTWSGATFSSLGVTPGTYIWNWGGRAHHDFFKLQIRAVVPDSGSTLGLLSIAFVGLIGIRFLSARHLSRVTRH